MTGRSLAADVRRARRSLSRTVPTVELDRLGRVHAAGAHRFHPLPKECPHCLAAQRRAVRATELDEENQHG